MLLRRIALLLVRVIIRLLLLRGRLLLWRKLFPRDAKGKTMRDAALLFRRRWSVIICLLLLGRHSGHRRRGRLILRGPTLELLASLVQQ